MRDDVAVQMSTFKMSHTKCRTIKRALSIKIVCLQFLWAFHNRS